MSLGLLTAGMQSCSRAGLEWWRKSQSDNHTHTLHRLVVVVVINGYIGYESISDCPTQFRLQFM